MVAQRALATTYLRHDRRADPARRQRDGSVPVVGLPEVPGVRRRAVVRPDVAKAPTHLGVAVPGPVAPRLAQLPGRQRLRDAVSAGARVARVAVPAGLAHPDLVQRRELSRADMIPGPDLERGHGLGA